MTHARILSMPMTADYVRLALREGRARGVDGAEILRGTGLTEDRVARPDALTTQHDNLIVFANMTRHLGSGWLFRVRLGPETTGPLGQAFTTAPTLREAFRVLARFGQSRSPRYDLRLASAGRTTTVLRVVETMEQEAEVRLGGDEGIMLSLYNMIETLVGAEMADARLSFRSPAPPHADLYRTAFRGAVAFGAPETAISFPTVWLDRPGPFANPSLFPAALAALEVERTILRTGGAVVAEVERVLASDDHSPRGLREAAAALGMSARTLSRRLKNAGTSFRAVRDGALERRARHFLSETDRPVEAISAALGYSDPVAFNAACHRWFGMAPRAWRRKVRPRDA